MVSVIIRPRLESDLPQLVEQLRTQQPVSEYPLRWPLPFPPEQFIVRDTELVAFVAQIDDRVVGHVSVTRVSDNPDGAFWSRGTGRPIEALGCLSVLFVGPEAAGLGVGGRLMDTAVAEIRARGLTPVLDVTQSRSSATAVYRHRGWRFLGHSRPEWLPDWAPDVQFFDLPDDIGRILLSGTVVRGHGVASGTGRDARHPGGTIAAQTPPFTARGVDLAGLEPATINLSLDAATVQMVRPTITLARLAWTDQHDAETFSLVRCSALNGDQRFGGYLYWPHPETKPDHFQPDSVIELLMPRITGLTYGGRLTVDLPAGAIRIS
ncbi:hypothetical protein GCM10027599_15080 [Yimella radicis]